LRMNSMSHLPMHEIINRYLPGNSLARSRARRQRPGGKF